MSPHHRQEAVPAGARLRAEAGSEAARLFDAVQRTIGRATVTLAAAERAETAGDVASGAAARRQAIALVDELQQLCGRLRQAQRGVAEALMLSGRLSAALGAYRQSNQNGSEER